MTTEKPSPPVLATTLPSGARGVEEDGAIRSKPGGTMVREVPYSRLYQDMVRAGKDRLSIEDSMVEEIQARVARLRQSDSSEADEESTIQALKESVEVMEAILRGREELVSMMEDELRALDRPSRSSTRRRPPAD